MDIAKIRRCAALLPFPGPAAVAMLADEIERLLAENEALRKYANHTSDCNLSSIYQSVALRGCNCGFDALAAKGE